MHCALVDYVEFNQLLTIGSPRRYLLQLRKCPNHKLSEGTEAGRRFIELHVKDGLGQVLAVRHKDSGTHRPALAELSAPGANVCDRSASSYHELDETSQEVTGTSKWTLPPY